MESSNERRIRERLSQVEENLLQAAALGDSALIAFDERWSTLLEDIQHAIRNNTIGDANKAFARVVALRVSILTEYLLDFQTNVEVMQDELENVFARIDISDAPNEAGELSTLQIPLSNPAQQALPALSCPPHVEPAYRWLMGNLHNPYPSTEVKDAISLQTGSYKRVVDAWFIDARKRMGWNALRRKRFSNKRVEIVDAATRFFVSVDPARPLDPNIELELVSLETRAKDLYLEKFSESALASKLDVAVKDMTPEMKLQAKSNESRRRQQEKEARDRTKRDAQAASSYPSPHRSLSLSPEPSLSSEEQDLSIVPPLSVTGRKRNGLSRDSPDCLSRPNKRSRYGLTISNPPRNLTTLSRLDVPSDIGYTFTSLPSPASSSNESFQAIDDGNFVYPSVTSTDSASAVSVANRKRRLSDADSQGAPKRPRNALSGPRLHAVSDPLSSPSTLSAWFGNHFGIASPATVDELDLSLPFDVELYDYSNTTASAILSGATGPSMSISAPSHKRH
jgi:hypothetical protein